MSINDVYVQVFQIIAFAAAVSLPLVVVCGIVERMYNALFGMIIGREVVKF